MQSVLLNLFLTSLKCQLQTFLWCQENVEGFKGLSFLTTSELTNIKKANITILELQFSASAPQKKKKMTEGHEPHFLSLFK